MNTPGTVAAQQAKRSLLEEFIFGAKNGFYLGVEKIIPAMILAYVLILFLKITGLMAIIGNVISPVMAIFGLPGEAIVALISAFFAKAAGAATAALAGLTPGTLTCRSTSSSWNSFVRR